MVQVLDFAQLVKDNVFLYKPAFMGRGVDILGVDEVLQKFQIERVDQVIDFLGLQGDSVDNIWGHSLNIFFIESYS